jgi:hypothetical protein
MPKSAFGISFFLVNFQQKLKMSKLRLDQSRELPAHTRPRGGINSNFPSWISPVPADEVVVPHIQVKMPNGSTARPCANEP